MNDQSSPEPATGYRELIEQNTVGIFEMQDDEFSYVNREFATTFGFSKDELVGSEFSDLLEDRSAFRADVAALARGDVDTVETTYSGTRKSGEEVVVHAYVTVEGTRSDPVYLGFVEDITDEVQRERRFESIFHNTFQFTGLLEPDGTILEANDTSLYFGGLERDDVVGKHVWDTYWMQSNEDARETAREAVEHARRGDQYRDEIRVQGEDEDLVIDFSVRPITDETGAVTRLVAEGHDVTDRNERAHERQTIIDRVTDAVVEIDENWRFTLVDDRAEEIYAMAEEDLLGEYFWDVFSGGVGTRWEEVYREVMDTREPRTIDEYFDQLDCWFHVAVYPKSDGGLAFYFQDVSDRRRQEERTAGLNDVLSRIMEAESKQEICGVVTEAAQEQLHLPVTTIALIDDRGSLRPAAQSNLADDNLITSGLFDGETGAAWRVFTSGEPTVIDDPAPYLSDSASIDELAVHPLGRHGVLVTGSPSPDPEFARTLAEDVRRAFDRLDHETQLQDRDELLEEQNESLNRLNRINNVIRSIDQVLVSASSRAEIEKAVCDKLTEGDTYTFAWLGEYESTTDQIHPRESAGHQQGYLETLSFTAHDGASGEPTGAAVRTREPVVVNDVLTDPPHEPWREAALRRGYRSCIAIPLTYRNSLYGVLTVYSDQVGLFDEMERRVLTELGETVAHAMNAVESKRALVSDSVVELELEINAPEHPLVEFVGRESGREFEFEHIVLSDEGEYRVFYRIHGASPDEYQAFADQTVAVRNSQLIAERDGSYLFESTITDESLLFWLLDRGAVPRSFTVTQDGGRLRVELSGDVDIRDFVERFDEVYPGTQLVASRERERTARTRQEFEAAVDEQLTARQREILQTAYFSGYFATPRDRTGEEIADSFGVSAPTFSDHIRAGLRNLLGLLYEDDEEA